MGGSGDNDNGLSARLLKVRKSLALDRDDLAGTTGVGKTSIGNYERGEKSPNTKFLEKLQQVSGVNLNWLVTGKGSEFILPDQNIIDVDLLEQCLSALEEKPQFVSMNTKNKALMLSTLYEQLVKDRS